MNTKEYTLTVKVTAIPNYNSNFPENAHAIEILGEMISDAKSFCIRLAGRAEMEGQLDLMNYLEGKIRAYEAIEKTMT